MRRFVIGCGFEFGLLLLAALAARWTRRPLWADLHASPHDAMVGIVATAPIWQAT